MGHHPDIGLVDTHAKGIGSHHDAHLIMLPGLLPAVFLSIVESGMEEGGLQASLVQQVGIFFGAPTTTGIDNGRTFHVVQDMDELLCLVARFPHDVGEVLALKAHAKNAWLAEMQLPLDVVDHQWRGGGCERKDGNIGKVFTNVGDGEIAGTEVITPLADAVGLVDADKANLRMAYLRPEKVGL